MSINNPNELLQKSKTTKYVLLILVIAQFLATLKFLSIYFLLVRDGAASILAFLLYAIASINLYIATLMQLSNHARANLLFKIAAIGLSASVPIWGISYISDIVILLGAILSVVGWWFTRKEPKKEIASNS